MPSPEDWEKGGSVAFATGVGRGEQEKKKIEFQVPEGTA